MTDYEGTVKSIVFRNEQNSFTVLNLITSSGDSVRIAGMIGPVHDGDNLAVQGKWEEHPRYGRTFKIESYTVSLPKSLEGIQAFLESGAIKGIGPKLARQIVTAFGMDTLRVLEEESDRLRELPNIGQKRLQAILGGLDLSLRHRDTIIYLQGLSLSPNVVNRAIQKFGDHAGVMVRENPYILVELSGIGFKRADAIARTMGIAPDDPQRLQSGFLYVLGQFIDQGHCFTPLDEILEAAQQLLEVEFQKIEMTVEPLVEKGKIVIAGESSERIYRADLAATEMQLSQQIKRLMTAPLKHETWLERDRIDECSQQLGFELSTGQRDALKELSQATVAIITGGPGTGKTTLVRALVSLALRSGLRVRLAAPTGRAAQRLKEATGREAQTIHRLLDFNPMRGGFLRHDKRFLEADLVVIDESSMLDVFLATAVCRAVPDGAVLVLVGDASQLPSIGPGNVLNDLISSSVIPVAALTEIFRQALTSSIVTNAHRINRGEMILLSDEAETVGLADFYFIRRTDPETVVETILHLVTERIPAAFHLDPHRDIQIISPMHAGVAGVQNLNKKLQEILNPTAVTSEFRFHDQIFRPGDRVMQIRNNYNRGENGVFNGDIGFVLSVDYEKAALTVHFDEDITYPFDELGELSLAYAITVHKSQGSEYPAVIIPLLTQHYVLLQRNLLYTAITRARKLVIVLGSTKALSLAIRNDRPSARCTGLTDLLVKLFPEEEIPRSSTTMTNDTRVRRDDQ